MFFMKINTKTTEAGLLNTSEIDEVFKRLKTTSPSSHDRVTVKDELIAFRGLVACLLSAQSRDSNTAKAKTALFVLADTPKAILALDDEAIAAAIKPAGLYNMKTRNLKRLCAALIDEHGEIVPRDRKGLMSLPGIGRKCADIMLSFSFGEAVIAVDTHVHRGHESYRARAWSERGGDGWFARGKGARMGGTGKPYVAAALRQKNLSLTGAALRSLHPSRSLPL